MTLLSLLLAALLAGATFGVRNSISTSAPAPTEKTERESTKWELPDCIDTATQQDLSLQTAASLSRQFKEACQAHGVSNSDVESNLFAFFDDCAAFFAQQPDRKNSVDLLQQAETLRAAPCDEPGLIYCQGRLLQASGQPAQALDHFFQAAALFDRFGYPAVLKARNAVSIVFSLGRLDDDPPAEQSNAWKSRAREYVAQAIAQGPLEPEDFRPFYELIKDNGERIFDKRDNDGHRLLVARIAELGGSETWLGQLLAGRDHYDQAWDFRGSGLASTVTSEGWQGFRDHLAQAVPHLQAARERQPGFPEPTQLLLAIAGLGHYPGPESRFELFRQIVCAQIDYWPAYRSLIWYSRPRWGGSARKTLDIVRMASESQRFDTAVPEFAIRLYKIASDDQAMYPGAYAVLGCTNTLWRDADGWDTFRRVYEGYLRYPHPIPFERALLARNYLDYAHQFDRPDEFLRIAAERTADGSIDPNDFARFCGYSIDLAAAKARLQTERPKAWARLRQACETGDVSQATTALNELAAAAPEADAYLEHLRRTLRIRTQLEPERDWQDCAAIPGLGLWIQRKGSWRPALDGAFLGATDCDRNMLLVHSSVPGGCEIAADVEILEVPEGEAPNVGLIVARSPSTFAALTLYPEQNEIRLSRGKDKYSRTAPLPPASGSGPRRLRLRFANGLFDAWIDGTPCFTAQSLPKMDAGISVRPGLGAFYKSENARCLFRNVRLHPTASFESP